MGNKAEFLRQQKLIMACADVKVEEANKFFLYGVIRQLFFPSLLL